MVNRKMTLLSDLFMPIQAMTKSANIFEMPSMLCDTIMANKALYICICMFDLGSARVMFSFPVLYPACIYIYFSAFSFLLDGEMPNMHHQDMPGQKTKSRSSMYSYTVCKATNTLK